jgi:hypothetical protein
LSRGRLLHLPEKIDDGPEKVRTACIFVPKTQKILMALLTPTLQHHLIKDANHDIRMSDLPFLISIEPFHGLKHNRKGMSDTVMDLDRQNFNNFGVVAHQTAIQQLLLGESVVLVGSQCRVESGGELEFVVGDFLVVSLGNLGIAERFCLLLH